MSTSTSIAPDKTSGTQPPLASGLPFIGSLLGLTQDSQAFLYEQYLKLGPIFRVKVLNQEFKVLAGPEVNLLMATQAEAVTAWDTWEPVVRDFEARRTLTMLDGPEHARLRRLMRQSFSRFALIEQLPQVVGIVQAALQRQALNTPIPVVRFMQRLTADILGTLSNNRLPADYFDDIVFWWNSLMEIYLSHLRPESDLRKPKYRNARARVKEFAQAVFDTRQAHRPADSEDNFLDNLADANRVDPEFLTRDEALFLTLAGYFAGLDTVANVSSFMLYELLRRPDLLARVRAEADAAFAAGVPGADAFRQMETLHAAAMETLRLYPVAGVLPRTATRDFVFSGYTVTKGETFMAATAAAHFSPRFYRDPFEFDITRYSEPRNEHKARGAYAPFGSGPHTCLGAGLAEVQIMLVTATLLHSADIDFARPGYKLKKAYTPSMSPKGLEMKITGRRV